MTGITNLRRRMPRLRRIVLAQPLQDVVRQERFLDISACAEQPAGGGERLGDFGDDSRRAENRELRAERGEQVTAMTLPPMIGMDGDLVDEGPGRPLGADQDADRVGAREGDHAAAAPDLQVADRPLERGRRHGRLVGKVRRPAAIQRVDEQPDVVRAAEAIRRHRIRVPVVRAGLRRDRRYVSRRDPCSRSVQRAHLVEVAAADGRDHLSFALGFRNVLALGFRNVRLRGAVARRRRRRRALPAVG